MDSGTFWTAQKKQMTRRRKETRNVTICLRGDVVFLQKNDVRLNYFVCIIYINNQDRHVLRELRNVQF